MGQSAYFKSLEKFRYNGSLDHLFELVSLARKAASNSDHSEYKVGVSLFSAGGTRGDGVFTVNANRIPDKLKSGALNTTGTNGTNPTSHGELLLLKDANPAQKNYLGCNFPNCPNCVKKAIIHGIYALVVDAHVIGNTVAPKAFNKKSIQERFAYGWENLSLPLIRAAGVHVLGVDVERNKIAIISPGLPRDLRPSMRKLELYIEPFITVSAKEEMRINSHWKWANNPARRIYSPQEQSKISHMDMAMLANRLGDKGERAAVARVHDSHGREYILGATESMTPGMIDRDFIDIEEKFANSRYTASVCPTVRLMMEAPKRGLSLKNGVVACNFLPQTGRHVDFVACGVDRLLIPESVFKASKRDVDFDLIPVIKGLGGLKYKPVSDDRLAPAGQIQGPPAPDCPDCS